MSTPYYLNPNKPPYTTQAIKLARLVPYHLDTIQRALNVLGAQGEAILLSCAEVGIDPDDIVDLVLERRQRLEGKNPLPLFALVMASAVLFWVGLLALIVYNFDTLAALWTIFIYWLTGNTLQN